MKGAQPPKRPFVNPVTAVRDGGYKDPCSGSPARTKAPLGPSAHAELAWAFIPAISDGRTGCETHRKLHAPHPFVGSKTQALRASRTVRAPDLTPGSGELQPRASLLPVPVAPDLTPQPKRQEQGTRVP